MPRIIPTCGIVYTSDIVIMCGIIHRKNIIFIIWREYDGRRTYKTE